MRSIVVLLAALAAGFAPAASAALPNPCTLLTTAQVTKVLGSKIASGQASGNARYRTCTWTGVDMARPSALPARRSLLVQLTGGATRATFTNAAEHTPGVIRISGIGELAYTDDRVLKPLYVLEHGYTLFIVAELVADPVQSEKAGAKLAVAKL